MSTIVKSVLGLSQLSVADKAIKAQSIKDAMQSSGNFPASSMPITYPTLQTLITNLHNAIVQATGGTSNDTVHMHEQERLLISGFNFIKSHIEFIANSSNTPESIITSAGLQIASAGGSNGVSELTLDAIGNGKLQVRVPRQTGEKAFVYEYSTDTGVSWTEFLASSLTKVVLPNLTPSTTIQVRYCAISKTGKSAISQVKTAIVL